MPKSDLLAVHLVNEEALECRAVQCEGVHRLVQFVADAEEARQLGNWIRHEQTPATALLGCRLLLCWTAALSSLLEHLRRNSAARLRLPVHVCGGGAAGRCEHAGRSSGGSGGLGQ